MLTVARAPGRLDVMGGIADYSGSLVLQMPIGEATHVALQMHAADSAHASGRRVRAVSLGGEETGRAPSYELPLADLFSAPGGGPTPLSDVREKLRGDSACGWAAYVVGVVAVLAHEAESGSALARCGGLSILVSSTVPEAKGVSSSAAVEVGTMVA